MHPIRCPVRVRKEPKTSIAKDVTHGFLLVLFLYVSRYNRNTRY